MDREKIARELLKLAKELVSKVEKYDSGTETRYVKKYDAELKKLMKGERYPTFEMRLEAAKIYDGKEFVNDNGITYKIKLNRSAKQEGDILKVEASKGNAREIKMISPSNVPFLIG